MARTDGGRRSGDGSDNRTLEFKIGKTGTLPQSSFSARLGPRVAPGGAPVGSGRYVAGRQRLRAGENDTLPGTGPAAPVVTRPPGRAKFDRCRPISDQTGIMSSRRPTKGPPPQKMKVQVKHGLSGIGTRIRDDAVPAFGKAAFA